MKKIKNIKTTKSYKQKKDKLVALKAKKKFYLKNTDWTQLEDVNISNLNEIKQWRKKLRDFEVTEDENTSEKKLESMLAEMPEPKILNASLSEKDKISVDVDSKVNVEEFNELAVKFASLQEKLNSIEEKERESIIEPQQSEDSDQDIVLDEKQARSFAHEIFFEYKNKRLVDNGILEYNMMRTLLEEAIDRRISPDSHGPLLEEYLNSNENISIDDIIENCREFFKNINGLYATLTKEQRNLYNMSLSELNNWFKENGHRYRCYDKD